MPGSASHCSPAAVQPSLSVGLVMTQWVLKQSGGRADVVRVQSICSYESIGFLPFYICWRGTRSCQFLDVERFAHAELRTSYVHESLPRSVMGHFCASSVLQQRLHSAECKTIFHRA